MALPRAILTDIEGTTTSIAFVHEELFPFARARMAGFVREREQDPVVAPLLDEVRGGQDLSLDQVILRLLGWIDADRKETALKALQGLIWVAGYQDGSLKGHMYPDATAGLRRWHAQGLGLYVYSSGSIKAQKLLYGHSVHGDLTPLFTGFYDTTSGHKRETASYAAIAQAMGMPAGDILFLSDVVEELHAARDAGMRTCWLQRDFTADGQGHPVARTFDEIEL